METPEPPRVDKQEALSNAPGIMWLPGLMAIAVLHLGVLAIAVQIARESGITWLLVSGALGTLVAFWVIMLLLDRWVGDGVALHFLGCAYMLFGLLFMLVALASGVWWLFRSLTS